MQENELDSLVKILSKLPALGNRSSRRIALHLIQKKEVLDSLINALQSVQEKIVLCPKCGNYDTCCPCSICTNPFRQNNQLCIVQDIADLWALERANTFKGMYHVLGGLLCALNGIGPEELNLNSLNQRIQEEKITEIIFALPATLEGQTTMHYISDKLAPFHLKLSTLSCGIPLGGELDYLDEGTLQTAFMARRDV